MTKVNSDPQELANFFIKTSEKIPGMIYQYVIPLEGEHYFQYVSDSAYSVYEVTREEFYKDPSVFVRLIDPASLQEYNERVEVSRQRMEEFDMVVPMIRRKSQEKIYVRARSVPIQQPDGRIVYYGMAIDITKEKETELRNWELESQLQLERAKVLHASRLSALGEMAGGVAHEINSPLAIIAGVSQRLKRSVESGDIQKEKFLSDIEKIEKTAFRIAQIIKGLRYFARDAALDPCELASLNTLIEDSLTFCRERFSLNGIELRISPIPQEWQLECRAVQIPQVLLNLLNNSFDAIQSLEEKWVSIEVSKTDRSFEIHVTDSGSGIPVEIQSKIMDPFFTTKEVGKGTGLGLSISKGIIESHGGTFCLVPESPHTQFKISLPVNITQ